MCSTCNFLRRRKEENKEVDKYYEKVETGTHAPPVIFNDFLYCKCSNKKL